MSNIKIKLEFNPNLSLKDNLVELSNRWLDGCYFKFTRDNCKNLSLYCKNTNKLICCVTDNADQQWELVTLNYKVYDSCDVYIPNSYVKTENLKGYNIQVVVNFLGIKEFIEEVSKFISELLSTDKDFLDNALRSGQIRNLPSSLGDDDHNFCMNFRGNPLLVEKFKKRFNAGFVLVKHENGDFEVFE